MRQKISVIKTNFFDDIKKIVHFGTLNSRFCLEDNKNTSVCYEY